MAVPLTSAQESMDAAGKARATGLFPPSKILTAKQDGVSWNRLTSWLTQVAPLTTVSAA